MGANYPLENRSRQRLALATGAMMAILAAPARVVATPPGAAAPALVSLMNSYRALPQRCGDVPAASMAPLASPPALSRVRLGTGAFIEVALERAGYPVEHAAVIYIVGASDAPAAMTVLRDKYCHQLLGTQFSAVGAARDGDTWQVVLAEPQHPIPLPDPDLAALAVLAASNAARAAPRLCGDRLFAAAPPLSLNPALAKAALAHSGDMASKHYFSHQARDGSYVADRAQRAGYAWRIVGENIASGINTPEEAMAGWLESPGHCANIMNPAFTEMGAAYSLNTGRRRMYWTQVLGVPR
jgi:uncharacterized protein YkwD